MKLLLAILVAALTFNSTAGAASLKCVPCDDAKDTILSNSTEITRILKDGGQNKLDDAFSLANGGRDRLIKMSTLTKQLAPFEGPEEKFNRSMASVVIELCAPIVAGDMISVAEALFNTKTKPNVEKAKNMYRDVVITFTGPAYRSYVKKAEFALEDIKGMTFAEPKTQKKK